MLINIIYNINSMIYIKFSHKIYSQATVKVETWNNFYNILSLKQFDTYQLVSSTTLKKTI